MTGRQRLLSTGAGFSFSVFLTAAAQFFTFPLLISALGSEQWASLTLGTTIGMVAALLGGWGWPLTGGAEIASRSPEARSEYLLASLLIRLPLSAVAFVLMTLVVWLVPSPNTTATWLSAVASLVSVGLTPSWYFVGTSSPARLFLFFSLPSLGGILAGTAFALHTQDARMHAGTNLVAAVLTCVGCTYAVSRIEELKRRPRVSRSALRREFMGQRHSVGVGLLSSTNSGLPLIAVAQWFPQQLAAYALAERLYKLALTIASPMALTAHGRVPGTSATTTLMRLRSVLPWLVSAACATGLGFALLIPPASRLYTSGHIHISGELAAGFGVALTSLILSSTVGVAGLAVTNNSQWFLRSAVLGAMACVGGVVLGISLHAGAVGIAFAVAAAELVVVATQLGRLVVLFDRFAPTTKGLDS